MKHKVVNLYGGPGTGKSTTALALSAELKYLSHNIEYIPEYAKDLTWEGRHGKVFAAQDYIFGKQHFRLARVAPEVEFAITDSPLLLSLVYSPLDFGMPSFRGMVREAYHLYDNLDVFLVRNKPFKQAGRNQREDEAKVLDSKIYQMLIEEKIPFVVLDFGRRNPIEIISLMVQRGWIK